MKRGMITMGAVIGMTAGLLMASNMDRSTRKRIRKVGKRMMNRAEDLYYSVNRNMF